MWASVTNGIFLCVACASHHRAFEDILISEIKSVALDLWTEQSLQFMNLGGNANLSTFLNNYDLNSESDLSAKYASKAASYYRRKLAALVRDD